MKKESESKPEKNCGNCRYDGADCSRRNFCCAGWQPKAAETQEWEQMFNGKFSADFYAMATKHMDNVRAFIRAEIERVREEEKQAIVAFLRGHWLMTDGLAPMAGDIEQNRHRSEK
jgi:Zn-finger protein